jgi:hypothetical protein
MFEEFWKMIPPDLQKLDMSPPAVAMEMSTGNAWHGHGRPSAEYGLK